MSWDNPDSSDSLTDTRPGSLLDSCRKAIYERLKAIYFRQGYHFDIDPNIVPSNPRFFSSPNSLYNILLDPLSTTANLFHSFFKRSIPHIIHSFADNVSTYLPTTNHLQHVARYEWVDGLSPDNEKWAHLALFTREDNSQPWFLVNDNSFIIQEFYRRNPYFIPLLGKPEMGDYVLPLWRRLYAITLSMASNFIDLTEFFSNGGIGSYLTNAKTVLQQYDQNTLKYRAPFEIDVNKPGLGQVNLLPSKINRVFHNMIARDRSSGKYYTYVGPDREATPFSGISSLLISDFVEITDRVINDPNTITEFHMVYPLIEGLPDSFQQRYDPTEPGAYFGLPVVQDMINLLKRMKYLKEGTEIAGHISGYIQGMIRDNNGQTNYDNALDYNFDTRTGNIGPNPLVGPPMNPGSWNRTKINDNTGGAIRQYQYWKTSSGQYFLSNRSSFAGISVTPRIYVSPFHLYLDGSMDTTPFVIDVGGQTFSQPPEPPDFEWTFGTQTVSDGYNIIQGISEWNFQYH